MSTAAAVVISTASFVRWGHSYLARGVVGDLLGLGILAFMLGVGRRRLRHEAIFCLACIGAVLVADPDWPLQIPGIAWWSAVTAGVAAYVTMRQRLLR